MAAVCPAGGMGAVSAGQAVLPAPGHGGACRPTDRLAGPGHQHPAHPIPVPGPLCPAADVSAQRATAASAPAAAPVPEWRPGAQGGGDQPLSRSPDPSYCHLRLFGAAGTDGAVLRCRPVFGPDSESGGKDEAADGGALPILSPLHSLWSERM